MSEGDHPLSARLEAIDSAVTDNFVFTLRPECPLTVAPGQFVELSLPGIGAFPVSPCARVVPEQLQVCVRRAGRVTNALYRLRPGAVLGVRGPFGNGFPLDAFSQRDVLLIAGGLGMAPLMALLDELLIRRQDLGSVTVLYGARAPRDLLFLSELQRHAAGGAISLRLSVEQPSSHPWSLPGIDCRIGPVTTLLGPLHRPEQTVAAVCGPPVLYGVQLEQLAAAGIPAPRILATLERRMRCGVGLCCHCVAGGRYVCRDGPVFSLATLRTMEGAI